MTTLLHRPSHTPALGTEGRLCSSYPMSTPGPCHHRQPSSSHSSMQP